VAISFRGIQTNANSWGGTATTPIVGIKPSGVVSGDFMIARVVVSNEADLSITPPSGWTLYGDAAFSGSRDRIYYRWAGESEPSSWTWAHNSATQPDLMGYTVIAAYSGVHLTEPLGQRASFNGTVTSPWSAALSGVTTTYDGALLIQAPWTGAAHITVTTPGSMTERLNAVVGGTSIAQMIFGWADEVIATAASTGTRTWTISYIGSSLPYYGWSFALNPIPAATVTSVTPAVSTTDGGTAVSITGENFDSSATVTIGGSAATSVVVVSPTTITCITPAHAAGAVDLVVTGASGSDTLTDGITYVSVADNIVKLVKGGSVVGDSKSVAGDWPVDPAWKGYGGPTDLWGTTLTPSDVNAANFGVVLSATVGTDAVAYVDAVRLKVYYSRPGVAQNTPMLALLTVDADRTTVTPRVFQLPRGGHRIAGDASIDRSVSDAHFYTSRIYSPSRNVTKAYRDVEFYLRTATGTNVPGVQVWASIDGATAVQLRNASGGAFTASTTGTHRAYFPPGAGSTGKFVRMEFRVPALASEQVAMDVRISDITLRLSHRPLAGRIFTVPIVIGTGEHEDRMTERRTAREQLNTLRDLVDEAAAVPFKTPEGQTGYAHVIGLKARELAYIGANESAYYAEVTMREVSYGS